MSDFLSHEGVKRKSGRYPWGSGENPYQHESWFEWATEERKLRDQGLSDVDIAKSLHISTGTLRSMRSHIKEEKYAIDCAWCARLRDHGNSPQRISEIMGISESKVRYMLKPREEIKESKIKSTAEMLKREVDRKHYIDVGDGVELYLGCSKERKNTALLTLKNEGYEIHNFKVPQQQNPEHLTEMKILCPPGTSWNTLKNNLDRVHIIDERTNDDGRSWFDIKPPTNVDSSRVYIRYGEDGGKEKDGVIELRRGVEDLDMAGKHYAQVRIATDGKYYMKGMAIYSDDIPKGYDIIYNTNKPKGTDKYDVFKKQNTKADGTVDIENPFNAALKSIDAEGKPVGQRTYIGKDGKEHLSALNIIKEEGDWENYKKSVSAQFLSKQEVPVAKQQMDISYQDKKREFEDILKVTNPVVKQKLLKSFADDCDSSAAHLKVAAFPRQCSRVLIPLTKIKDTEIYAPGFKNGEKVVLIRYPHGGRFEIPELTVNNHNPDGKKTITNLSKDAVGINSRVANVLSGADFDGDTVLVIPNNLGKIKGENTPKFRMSKDIQALRSFDPSAEYPAYPGMPKVDKKNFHKQQEMGTASNLITDMTLKGASASEIARAVKYSMVVIDAEKHNLAWRVAQKDLRIEQLRKEYQGKAQGGASTLISKANKDYKVDKIRDDRVIWNDDGSVSYLPAKEKDRFYIDEKTGKQKERKSNRKGAHMYEDAFELSSGTLMENAYAAYSNRMKNLAKEARKAYLNVKVEKRSPSAAKAYSEEVISLDNKLKDALRNSPIARKANLVAYLKVRAAISESPVTLEKDEKNRLRQKALAASNAIFGAGRKQNSIKITPKEWEAIQARAISGTRLKKLLEYSDLDVIKEYATPRTVKGLSVNKISSARALLNMGYTQEEVAEKIGCSVTTLLKYI